MYIFLRMSIENNSPRHLRNIIFYSPQINHYRIDIERGRAIILWFFSKIRLFRHEQHIEMRERETSTSFHVYPVVLRWTRTYNNNIICEEKNLRIFGCIFFSANISINHRSQQTMAMVGRRRVRRRHVYN